MEHWPCVVAIVVLGVLALYAVHLVVRGYRREKWFVVEMMRLKQEAQSHLEKWEDEYRR